MVSVKNLLISMDGLLNRNKKYHTTLAKAKNNYAWLLVINSVLLKTLFKHSLKQPAAVHFLNVSRLKKK